MHSLRSLLIQLAFTLPYVLLYACGVIFAVLRLAPGSRARRLVITGCSVLLARQVLGVILVPLLWTSDGEVGQIDSTMQIYGLFSALITALGGALILAAVFVERHQSRVA
ncbi:MAG: hypothetical protein IT454_01015 [Planctomycetes bacterium]|nr:hypothetical protein [Planctomycetota bacterium]